MATTLVKNGTVVTASDRYDADIYIEKGVITLIGQGLSLPADTVVDAAGVALRPHFKTHQSHAIGMWFREAGNPRELEVRDDDHPLFPNAIMFAGAGATVAYEVDPDDYRALGSYDRQQLLPTVREVLRAYDPGQR